MAGNQSASQGFGALSKSDAPVSYSKKQGSKNQAALTIGEFKRQSCAQMRIGIGPRSHAECPHVVTFQEYHPDDSSALQNVISAAYRQVFGNLAPTDNERCASLEARLMNGDISVQGFVKGLAKTSFYKNKYFHSVSPQRGIELNFKHLLGRAPLNQSEVAQHIALLASDGYDAVVDCIADSGEYQEVFGSNIVPYARSFNSPAGNYTSSFPALAVLERSFATSDNAVGRRSQLVSNLARGTSASISVPAQVSSSGGASSGSGTKAVFASKVRSSSDGGDSTPIRNDVYVGFGLGQREQEVFQRCPGDNSEQVAALIRSTYRQVMGNPHLMEFERCSEGESKYLDGFLSTREFVRAIALSPEYSRRFFETNAPYRFVELNFKHILGRAPISQAEVSEHIRRLADEGYEAEINSYVDSEEYQSTFGEDTVPYVRILTESGRSQLAFNRHLSLAEGYAASDTSLTSSALVNSVATGATPSGWSKTTTRINRNSAISGSSDPTKKRFRIVVQAQPAGARQRTSNSSYLVSGKDMSSQMQYIHRRGGRIVSITEVL